MKYLRVGIPFFIITAVIINAVAAYRAENMPAVHANITALCGWLAIAVDEAYGYYNTYMKRNVV